MRLPYKYREITIIDEEVVDKINDVIIEGDWYAYDYRKPMFPSPKEDLYNSILIRHSSEYKIETIKNMPLFEKYYVLIQPVLDKLKEFYDYVDYVAFLTRLKPGGILNYHADRGEFLETIHRLHLPIKTNEKALYFVEDEWIHWKKGSVYEFDNQRIHNIKNDGDSDRIHLIINLYPREK